MISMILRGWKSILDDFACKLWSRVRALQVGSPIRGFPKGLDVLECPTV